MAPAVAITILRRLFMGLCPVREGEEGIVGGAALRGQAHACGDC